ncbi:MAG: EamA family transporter [Clostridia bacterium]|nr:EamA family transporter [Clostridia bacterium]
MNPSTVITLIISMAACLMGYILKKIYTNRSSGGMTGVYVYSALGCIVSAVVLVLWGGVGSFSLFTCLLGVLFGLAISLMDIFMIKAFRLGPMSFTTVIVSFSTVLTALSGFFFFDESIGVLQLVGIVLMVGSFVFATEKKDDEKKGGFRWLLFSLLAFLCSGSIGFMQKIHQSSAYKEELNAFLVISFAVSFVFSAALALLSMKKESLPLIEKNGAGKIYWLLLVIMVISGVCVAANHKLNLALSGEIPSAVFFPIVNGGNLVLTTLSALVIFRERLTKKQWIGVILGVLSVLFLCMPTDWIFSFSL